jgi:site-specific DNA recombinase
MSRRNDKKSNIGSNLLDDYKSSTDYEGREGLIYARVSSKRQEIEGGGLQSQEKRCMNDLLSVNVPYVKTFPDSYTGGGDFMKRPAMRDLLAYIDANPHKKYVVVFDDLKRFARDVEFHLKLRAAFKMRGILLRCLNYNFDESPEGRYAEIIMAGNAELERHQNRRQVIQKQKARFELGYWPFGFKKGYSMVKDPAHTGKFAKVNDEGKILKLALEGFASAMFVRKIDACKFLVEKGFWKHSPERRIDEMDAILRDVFYAGQIEYLAWDVTRRKGQHDAIISMETFEAIQRRLKKDGIHKRVRLDITEDFPQRGLTVCDSCEKHLTAAWSKGNGGRYGFYYCQNSICPLYRKSARKDDVEIGFNKLLKKTRLKKNVDKIVATVFDRVWKEEISDLMAKETALERRRKDLKEKIGQLSDAALKAKSEEIREAYEWQMQEAANALKEPENQPLGEIDYSVPYRTALSKATGMLKNPSDTWEALGVREKQKLFFFIFEKKLAYSIKDGYRTDEIPTAARLFESFVVQNTSSVEMGGIEPPCNDDANEPSTSVV